MKTSTGLKLALNITLHSKLRSWLTVLGIVIGVAAVVAIISIGEGMQASIQSRITGVGEDLITVSPGGRAAFGGFRGDDRGPPGGGGQTSSSSQGNLTPKDISVLKSITNVKFVQGIISGRADVYYLGEKTTASVQGVDPLVWQYMTTSELDTGRLLGPTDTNVVIIGSEIASKVFKQPLGVNRDITIEDKVFKVVGILKESGEGGSDNAIIMPVKTAGYTLEDADPEVFNSIQIKVNSVDNVDQVMADADTKLALSRHVIGAKKKDYTIRSQKAQAERFTEIASTMTLFLAAIAAVSLIVGAVGIANTMFTAVLEKTKEIGIMKAIGAKNRDIMLVFILNAAMVGLAGGILGLALGAGVSKILPLLGNIGIPLPGAGGAGGFSTIISWRLMMGALLLAMGIGIGSGVIPAYRASKLRPVDALRYE
jgi:putative ABC transport system permease protein